ncbi:MAG: TIR domain-containing protein [Thiotrichales bacterium]
MDNSRIFISYRRSDASGHAGRLFDSLKSGLPHGTEILMDLDFIAPGQDFVRAIDHAIENSKALIVLIGDDWTTVTNHAGQSRLQDPGDFVRAEVAAALERGILVIPVLVEGATMPTQDQLPPELAGLIRLNALELSDSRWRYDTDRLVALLVRKLELQKPDDRVGGKPFASYGRAYLAGGVAIIVLAALAAIGVLWLNGNDARHPPLAHERSSQTTFDAPIAQASDNARASEPRHLDANSGVTVARPDPLDRVNLLLSDNGGEVIIATQEDWKKSNDGDDNSYFVAFNDEYAVFGLNNGSAAQFNTFALLINAASPFNVDRFELLASTESPTGPFRSIGVFRAENYRNMKNPFQPFEFPRVSAKYFKFVILSNHGENTSGAYIHELRLMNQPSATPSE